MEELENLEGSLGPVVGFTDFRDYRGQPNRTQDFPQYQSRPACFPLEKLVELSYPGSDPLNRGRLEQGVSGSLKQLHLCPESLDPLCWLPR